MAPRRTLRTLRATPRGKFQRFHLTYQFIQSRVECYGQTTGLKRSKRKIDYFDIQFDTPEDARDVLRLCKIAQMDLQWAPRNIVKKAPVPGIASYQPPRFDYHDYSVVPSLPVPCNMPYITKWHLPKKIKDKEQEPACYYHPSNTQPEPVNPCPPFLPRVWPNVVPRYEKIKS